MDDGFWHPMDIDMQGINTSPTPEWEEEARRINQQFLSHMHTKPFDVNKKIDSYVPFSCDSNYPNFRREMFFSRVGTSYYVIAKDSAYLEPPRPFDYPENYEDKRIGLYYTFENEPYILD